MLRWLAQRWGLGRADPYITALSGLGKDATVPFPRELVPMIATQSARALMASQVFQSGPDWLWPFWVNRQMDPRDAAYMPRAMSPLWHNLTHRNWTAVGVPDGIHEGVVDTRGLLMPQKGGWSIDIAVRIDGQWTAPARLLDGYSQEMAPDMPLVTGRFAAGAAEITTQSWAERLGAPQMARLRTEIKAKEGALRDGLLALSIRPYNPEGPAVIHRLEGNADGFSVEGKPALVLADKPEQISLSTFWEGDALWKDGAPDPDAVYCPAGMSTGAALYPFTLQEGESLAIECAAFIEPSEATRAAASQVKAALRTQEPDVGPSKEVRRVWRDKREGAVRIELCDQNLQRLYEQCHTTLLVLDDTDSIKPGPFTYHQHWFRDSAYLVTALGRLGHRVAARQKLSDYPDRQDRDGFFKSQDGEWDSNGQAIWTLIEHAQLFGDEKVLRDSWSAIEKGARWIVEKRKGDRPAGHEGLLPSGISAEHLGPHDYYYWDDFWGVAGLRSAAWGADRLGRAAQARELLHEADLFMKDIDASLATAAERSGRLAMPAAPSRNFDCGMIGNVASVYPLELMPADDPRVTDTLAVLEERFFLDDAFLQAMVHSGLNIYLTLQCAQVYMRAGRIDDAWRLATRVQALAMPGGNWPEAIHPRTLGGCMGDGCHGWAAAELCLFVRSALVHETPQSLFLTPGFPGAWRAGIGVQRMPTYFGDVTFAVEGEGESLRLFFEPSWRGETPEELVWVLPAEIGRAETKTRRLDVPPNARQLVIPTDTREVRVWLSG